MPYLRYRQAPAKGTQTEDAPKRARFRQHRSFGLKIGGFQIGRFCVNAKIYFSFSLIFRGSYPLNLFGNQIIINLNFRQYIFGSERLEPN
jgi:hypothetical protein